MSGKKKKQSKQNSQTSQREQGTQKRNGPETAVAATPPAGRGVEPAGPPTDGDLPQGGAGSTERWSTGRILLFLVPMFFLFSYAIGFWPGLPGANESAHVYAAMAMYERGERNVDQEVLDYFFNHDLVMKGTHFVSNKPPGPALWLLPGLAAIDLFTPGRPELWTYHYFGRVLMVTLPFIIFLFIFGRFLEGFMRPILAWSTVFAFALGTNASAYATMMFSHNLAGMALALTLMLIWRGPPRWLWLGGLMCGFAVLCEYRAIGISGVLAVLSGFDHEARFRWKRCLIFCAAGFPLAAALLVHNLATTGSVFGPYLAEMKRFRITGFLGFGLPSPTKTVQTLFSPALGLFFFSPWLALVIPATIFHFRERGTTGSGRRDRILLLGTVVAAIAHLILVVAHKYYVGGALTGPRYVTASIPFYVIPIAFFLRAIDRRMTRGARIGLIAAIGVAVVVHLVILSTTCAINTHRDALGQNAIKSFIFPLLNSGISSLSVLRYYGASVAVSHVVYVLIALTTVAGFAVPWLLKASGKARMHAVIGGAAGVLLFGAWVLIGTGETKASSHHIPRLTQFMSDSGLRRNPDGTVWFKPRPVAVPDTPIEYKIDVRSEAFHRLIPKSAKMMKIAQNFYSLRAPLWRDDGSVLFSDTSKNTVFRRTPDAKLEIFRAFAGYTGIDLVNYLSPGICDMVPEPDGSILMTEHGNRRITRLKPDGSLEVVADKFGGKRFNSPSFLARANDGTIYFTDPPLGMPFQHNDTRRELDFCGVYRLRNGQVELLERSFAAPMGIVLSPDERFLYVGNFAQKEQAIYRFTLGPGGQITNRVRLIDMTNKSRQSRIEAFEVDREGNLYVCGPGAVFLFNPAGAFLGALIPPYPPMAVRWGGPDGKRLLISCIDLMTYVETEVGRP